MSMENSRRRRVLSNPVLRFAARAIVHVQPHRIGQVAEAWEGVFRMRPFGLPLKYRLGPRDTIGNILLWCGCRNFETETIPTFVARARTARGVLDIGANTGLFTLLACAANPAARVIAWEPVPYLYAKCTENLDLNQFSGRVEARPHAVSNVSGSATLYVPVDTTMASLNPSHIGHYPAAQKGSDSAAIRVKVETVDEMLPPDFPVDLIKLDVETHEYEALCGMRATLEKWKPAVIFECLPALAPAPIEKLFGEIGYKMYRLSANGPVLVEHLDPGETIDQNFLAQPGTSSQLKLR